MILPRVTVLIICADIWSMHMKKVIILLDEYDTPMQEANVYGYWEEMTSFCVICFMRHLRQISIV